MKLLTSDLTDRRLAATDGEIGKIKDVLFDDDKWALRYLEVNPGNWLSGRRVLLSPVAIIDADNSDADVPVRLTKHEIEHAPDIGNDEPVSRQYEMSYAKHYGYSFYWLGGGIWGSSAVPGDIVQPLPEVTEAEEPLDTSDEGHLRLASEVRGYRIDSLDGAELGTVDDFLIDSHSWEITHLLVKTGSWFSHRIVPLPVKSVTEIIWAERRAVAATDQQAINDAPAIDLPMTDKTEHALNAHFSGYRQTDKV